MSRQRNAGIRALRIERLTERIARQREDLAAYEEAAADMKRRAELVAGDPIEAERLSRLIYAVSCDAQAADYDLAFLERDLAALTE